MLDCMREMVDAIFLCSEKDGIGTSHSIILVGEVCLTVVPVAVDFTDVFT